MGNLLSSCWTTDDKEHHKLPEESPTTTTSSEESPPTTTTTSTSSTDIAIEEPKESTSTTTPTPTPTPAPTTEPVPEPEPKPFKFTAPDGTGFHESKHYRKYMFATYYSFSDRENELLCKKDGDIDGQAFNLSRLTSCEVQLLDHSDQVLADYLTDCRIFIGPAAGSVFLRNCTNCSITVAAKQLRTRDCKNCRFYVYSKTEPVIEMTEDVEIRRFNGEYEGMDAHFKAAKLDRNVDNWDKIHDFSKTDKDLGPLPHFKLIKLVPTKWIPVTGVRTSERPRLSSVTYDGKN